MIGPDEVWGENPEGVISEELAASLAEANSQYHFLPDEEYEKTAIGQIEEMHPDLEWKVCLLNHGQRVGVRAMYFGRGKQIIGPREDVIKIADALAEEVRA